MIGSDAIRYGNCGSVSHRTRPGALMQYAAIMDNDDYPPKMRKPMRDSHFAVTRGQGRSVTVTKGLGAYTHRHRVKWCKWRMFSPRTFHPAGVPGFPW